MSVVGVVVAAGRGDRLGGALPKQYRIVAGRSLLERAVEALASQPAVRGVVVVLPQSDLGARATAVRRVPGVIHVVGGGDTRAASVRSGVLEARSAEFVLVHDAARPSASPALVAAVIEATLAHGAAVPLLAVTDTVKEDDGAGFVARTVPRQRLGLAQTPQGARTAWLLEALDACAEDGVEPTDESMALERAGRRVCAVPGEPANRKITTESDLAGLARALSGGAAGLRVGTGFDVHAFTDGRPLVLGGVQFTGERGLAGHSDADVVLHAAMDAVLGGAGMGDIGTMFPPDDAQWAGADSRDLAARVAARLAEAGFAIVNVDLTVLAERPRIGARVEAMRAAVAAALGVEAAQIGLKATTLEGLGSLGRAEGIACQAVALLGRREAGS
jgi:2-C-methyl-D-erythritol 4-phosphate cytidylyltransferase/2-C-methyl-D-erythritol 2,4-cyclodiphosphate synthase